jgi:hypothetical protein
MAKIGVKYPIYAEATETDTEVTYSNAAVLARAISVDVEIEVSDAELYADDVLAESDKSFSGGTVTIGVDDLYDAAKIALLDYIEGAVADAGIGTNELSAQGAASPAYVGFGFYGKVIRNKVPYWRAIFLKKVQFSEPSDSFATKGETTEFTTPELEGTITLPVDGIWKEEATFSTEAGAKAWLNAKVGLPVSASGGLTNLTAAGTGGSLSPSFGADVRYYAFDGLTGSSFTVTATAAGHTLKLYVDGVFTQNLTSGSASSAIAMSIGTKQIKIIAQEPGKAPQTTEIIAVKVS